ncbi:MAG: hypothetical protein JSW36_07300 [Burkholderiales bacterium]|nr:MAG: hypothetical protein JSW36_07300 [Burkholderiales bacterium]
MSRIVTVAALVAFAFASPAVFAESSTPSTQDKKVRVAKASKSRQELSNQAKGLALATETVQSINDNQLQIASRVLTGRADCEFNQTVSVEPWAEHPGHFKVAYKNATYTMVPEETTTGAVRLEDKRAGVMWLQIPSKSMLMNSKVGQRMVDACTHAEQRVATTAAREAGR